MNSRASLRQLVLNVPIISRYFRSRDLQRAKLSDILCLQKLQLYPLPPIAWTSSAIRPSTLHMILNEIRIHKRKSLIEFGAGISTFYFAQFARETGANFLSVEQDKEWIAFLRPLLNAQDLLNCVELVHVPAVEAVDSNSLQPMSWFHLDLLNDLTKEMEFDLAFVDAPISQAGCRNVRGPAGPWLAPKLKEDFCVFLDDINRPGEQEIANAWVRQMDWQFSSHWPTASAGVFRRKGAKAFNIC